MKPLLLALAAIVALNFSLSAQAAEPEPIAKPPEITVPQGPTPPQDGRNADPANAWRFKRQNGLWWYWLPSERWVVHLDGRWVDYDPKTFGELMAQRAQRNDSYGSWRGPAYHGGTYGWGPVGVSVGPAGVRVHAYGVNVGVNY